MNLPGHTEHTDTCMSEWGERTNAVIQMTPATVAANHQLHMQDVWFERGKGKYNSPRFTSWPSNENEWCAYYKGLDVKFHTSDDSVLHHDNRCPIHTGRVR